MTILDLARIQGFVVTGYSRHVRELLLLRVENVERAAAWISAVLPEVVTADRTETPTSALNLAFSYAGLAALRLPDATLAGFPEEFRAGMAARADLLGDTGHSAPEHWDAAYRSGGVHVLVMVSAKTESALAEHVERIAAGLDGLAIVGTEHGATLSHNGEHFGFADGFSQPSVEGSGVPPLPGAGAVEKGNNWRPIRAGEFILGYPDEENALPVAPPPDQLNLNGSYLVVRKLAQDVAGFRARLAATGYPGGPAQLAAKIVGRWPDGTPVELSPDRPVPDGSRNAFGYAEDPDGHRCPLGAHVRRANPRDSLPFEGKLVNRHRMIRRGIPYGPELPPGAPDDGVERGLLFLSLQASIVRQFEFVQSQWLSNGNAFGLGKDEDVIMGTHESGGKMTVNGTPPYLHGPLSRLVTTRGGEYFFVPGTNGLRFIATAAGGGAA